MSTALTLQYDYDVVLIRNVQFSGASAVLTFDVGSMMQLPGGSLQVLLCECTVTNGALIHVKGGTSATTRNLRLIAQGLTITNGGGLAFSGTMPQNSIVSLVKPIISLTSLQQQFTSITGSPTPITANSFIVGVLFASFALTTGSSFVVSDGSCTGATSSIPFYIHASLSCTSRSVFSIQDTDIYNGRAMFAPGSITASSNSVIMWYNVYINLCCTGCNCIQYNGAVSISSYSALVMYKISADSAGGVLQFTTTVSFSDNSYWMLRGNVMQFGTGKAIQSTTQTVSVTSSSNVMMANNLFDGSPFSISFSNDASSNTWAMCNSAGGGAFLNLNSYGISGLQLGAVCAACNLQKFNCFQAYTSAYSSSCECTCSGIGSGEFCLPEVVPSVKVNCIQTDSVTVSEQQTTTLTYTDYNSRTASVTKSDDTKTMQLSESITFTVVVSETASVSASYTFSWQQSMTLSRNTRTPNTLSQESTVSASHTATSTLTLSEVRSSMTDSQSPSKSRSSTCTASLTDALSRSASESQQARSATPSPTESPSPSPTYRSLTPSFSNSSTPTEDLSKTESDTDVASLSATVSVTCSIESSSTRSLSASSSDEDTLSRSASDTPSLSDSITLRATKSWEPSQTRLLTLSRTLLDTHSDTEIVSVSRSGSWSLSDSATATITPSATPTDTIDKSASRSLSLSWCIWNDPPLNATPPMTRVLGTNGTMTIDYYEYTRNGCSFFLPDNGQWYLKNMTFDGTTDGVLYTPTEIAYTLNFTVLKPSSLYHPQIGRQVLVEVVFRCAVVNQSMLYIIDIPPSYALAPYNIQREAMRAAALLAITVTSTCSPAFFADTAISLGVLMNCQAPEDVTEYSLIPITIGEEASRRTRGAIIANIFVLWGGVVLVAGGVLLLVAGRNSCQLLTEEEELYLYPIRLALVIRKRLGRPVEETEAKLLESVKNLQPLHGTQAAAASSVSHGGDVEMAVVTLADVGAMMNEEKSGASQLPEDSAADVLALSAAVDAPPQSEETVQSIEPTAAVVNVECARSSDEAPQSVVVSRTSIAEMPPPTSQPSQSAPHEATQSRFFLEWARVRQMTGYPFSIANPAANAILQPTCAAGVALFRMQASGPDNALGAFAALTAVVYFVFVWRTARQLYLEVFGEVALSEELPQWYWDELLGPELRRRFGVYLRKTRRRLRKKKKKRRVQRTVNENEHATDQFDDDEKEKKVAEMLKKEEEKKAKKAANPPPKLSPSRGSIFVGLRIPWYAVFRLGVNIAFGFAAGTPPIKENICDLQTWVILLITVVHLAILLYWRPFRDRLEQYLSVITCLCLLCMCGCLAVATSSAENQRVAVDGASICLFIVIGFSLVQSVVHFYVNHRRMIDTWYAMTRHKDIPEPPPPPPLPPKVESDSSESVYEEYEEEESAEEYIDTLRETDLVKREAPKAVQGWTNFDRLQEGDDQDFFSLINIIPIADDADGQLPADDESDPPSESPPIQEDDEELEEVQEEDDGVL